MKLIFLLFALLGATCVQASLRTDFDELEAMIPNDKIIEIAKKYKDDPEIQKVITYLKSKEFAAVAHIIAGVPEILDMVNYLESKDLHPIEYINKFCDAVGLPHWPGSYLLSIYSWPRQTRSVRQMLDEIKAVIPMDAIMNWAMDKLMNSQDFQELFEKIQGLDYQKLHDNALKHPEIVDLLEKVNGLGIDTKKIWEEIKSIMGWE